MNALFQNARSSEVSGSALDRSSRIKPFARRPAAHVFALGAGLLSLAASLAITSTPAEAANHYWARVSSTGTVLASSGVTKVDHFGHGRYDVYFSHNLSSCALIGTVNTSYAADAGVGSASILVGLVNTTTLFVRTATPSATAGSSATVDDDRPFSLTITCP
jgi:hypothetical protein